MSRPSTTQKITKKIIGNLTNIFLHGDGLIVRYKGKEYGAIGFFDGCFTTIEGVTLEASKCTIRKGLPIIALPADQQQFIDDLMAVPGDRPGDVQLLSYHRIHCTNRLTFPNPAKITPKHGRTLQPAE